MVFVVRLTNHFSFSYYYHFFVFSFLFFGYWRNRKEFQWASTARVSLCARDPNDKMKRKKKSRKIRIIDITFKKKKKSELNEKNMAGDTETF